jgi:hypothetical protein
LVFFNGYRQIGRVFAILSFAIRRSITVRLPQEPIASLAQHSQAASNLEGNTLKIPFTSVFPAPVPLPPSQAGERLIAARFKPREGFGRIAILFFDRRSSAVRGGFRLPETVPTIPMKL